MGTILSPACHLDEPLTAAEEHILNLLAQGLSDKEIGLRLSIAPITVRGDHKQNIYDKLGLPPGFRNRKWAIHCARQLGLLAGVDQEEDHAPPGDNPYKGLDAFQQQDAHVFFGRETLIERLLARLNQNGSTPRFLAVVGPSGSGKSSVVRAGLIPALEHDRIPGARSWTVATMFPRVNPFFEMEMALRGVATKQQPDLLELLQRDAYGLARAARLILPEDRPLLLVIDQFEEIFTLVEDSALARRFMDLIYAAVTDPRSTVRVIITLRADFLDRPLMYPDFSWLVQEHTAMVVPLTPDELERAITLPAQQAHVTIDPGLVARLVAEAHEQPGALPLLEFALTELYDNRIGRTITMSIYDEVGGLQQALAAQAGKVYAGLDDHQQEAARQLFLRLITLGEGTEDVRRRVPTHELASLNVPVATMDYVTNFLAANRLLTLDLDPVTKEPLVEVAHEALIREWVQLRVWLDESRSDVRMERLLAIAVDDWHRHECEEGYLMQGAKLAQFEAWRVTTDLALTAAEREFLDAGITERDRQRRRRRRIRNLVLTATVTVAVVMTVLALWANHQRGRAEDEKSRAETAQQEALRQAGVGLAAQAVTELGSDAPERGVLLALEAAEHYPYTSQAERALAQTVYATHQYITLRSSRNRMLSIAFSPDGMRVAAAERSIEIWDSVSGDRLTEFSATNELSDFAGMDWSADGRFLVTASLSLQTACVWDVETGEEGVCYTGHDSPVNKAYLSPDDRLVLTASSDGTAHIWSVDTGETVQVFAGHGGGVNDAAWSPDGRQVATASDDGTVRFWDVDSGHESMRLDAHLGGVTAVSWSSDGTRLASSGNDGLGRVWDAQTGKLLLTLIGHAAVVRDIEWSPDGTLLATAGGDGLARIWESVAGSELFALGGGDADIIGVSWSPDGQRLVVGGGLASRVWDVSTPIVRLVGHTAGEIVYMMTNYPYWSPDSRWVGTGGYDENAYRLWDPVTGENLKTFESVTAGTASINSAGTDIFLVNPVRIVNLETGEERSFPQPEEFAAGQAAVFASWSPDGKYLLMQNDVNPEYAIYVVETQELVFSSSQRCTFNAPLFWSPDSQFLAQTCLSGEYTSVQVTEALTGEVVREFYGHTDAVVFADWSPDGTRLATASSDRTVRVWDFETGETLTVFTGHAAGVFDVDWSPDGTRLVSGDTAGNVLVWDAETGEEVNRYNVGGSIVFLEWSPDGTRVLTTGVFNAPDIHPVWQSTEDLIAYAKQCCVWRDLTPEEREQFGLPEPRS